MVAYSLGKALQYALVLFVAVTVNFALPRLAPGDPLDYLLGEQAFQLRPEQRRQILAQFELDRPVPEQFRHYLAGLARGGLGNSVRFGQPVRDLIAERLPWTLALVGTSIVIASLLGTVGGVLAAWKRGGRTDIGTLSLVMFLDSTPLFWLGMLVGCINRIMLLFGTHGAIPRVGPFFGPVPGRRLRTYKAPVDPVAAIPAHDAAGGRCNGRCRS